MTNTETKYDPSSLVEPQKSGHNTNQDNSFYLKGVLISEGAQCQLWTDLI